MISPTMNIRTSDGDEVPVLENLARNERLLRREHVDDEEIEPDARDDRFDDDLARAEPVLVGAAVEHELQRAEADAEQAKPDQSNFSVLSRCVSREEQNQMPRHRRDTERHD